MGKSRRIGDLELPFDPAHEEREWVVQRVGWVLMGLIVVAALLGLLGPGPLSKRHEGKVGDALYVEYQRFGRYQAPAELKVFCRPERREQFELTFDRNFIERSEIKEISPEPEETSAEGDRYTYRFKRGEGEEHLVTFRIEAGKFGRASSKITLDQSKSVNIRLFYWP
jgi:hypothetical protein